MKTRLWKIILAILFSLPVCAYATPITKNFYTDGQIVDGNYFDEVDIWNNANVDMTGGEVMYLRLHDTGQLDLTSGTVSSLIAFNNSIIEMSNGHCGSVTISDSSIMYLSGGSIGTPYDPPIPGYRNGSISIGEDAVLHIYGYNFNYIAHPTTDHGSGLLTGYWADTTSFEIYFRYLPPEPFPGSSVVLHIIPEPCMFGLFSFGFLVMRERIKGVRHLFCIDNRDIA